MRLIDADNLKPTEGMFIYQTKDRDTVVAVEAYRWELIKREAPTVKAIPIEWIMKKLIEADNTGMGIDDWSAKDCYRYVLEQWEKENEK